MSSTPGPWLQSSSILVCAADGRVVSNCMSFGDIESLSPDLAEAEANARLITAAPDLLEALTWLADINPDPELDDDDLRAEWTRKARTAIAKATGEAA